MDLREIASFKVNYLQILDENGNLVGKQPADLSPEQLKQFFRQMLLVRELDRKTVNLQRQGRLGIYAPCEGQEACHIGSAALLKPEDWVFPAFREQGVMLLRGIPLRFILLFYMGCSEGNRFPEGTRTFPISVAVASQMPMAVGCAMAMKLKKERSAVVTYFSDGATSEGDFNESLNFATVYQTPNVFICENNQWAISVPRSLQSAAKTLAQKAIAYEMDTLQVDGNDVFAVYQASQHALERARNGEGPTFLEFVTYRRQMHTTADDPKRYIDPEQHEQWLAKDPISRFEIYLKKQNIIDDSLIREVEEEAEEMIRKEYEEAERILAKQTIEDIFQYTYESMPANLKEQLEEVKKYVD